MSKVRNFSEIAPNIAFPEFNFYELYYSTFEKSELGKIKKLLPLREMSRRLGIHRPRTKFLDVRRPDIQETAQAQQEPDKEDYTQAV